jgi:hypothetical protein
MPNSTRPDKLQPMKRILIVLIASVALLGSSQSQASSFSFGISLQGITDLKSVFPLGAIQIGYDFGTASEGFSLEAYGFTLLFFTEIGVQGFYRIPVSIPVSNEDSNIYVGAGALLFVGFVPGVQASTPDLGSGSSSSLSSPLVVHGLIGWEAPINSEYTYFLEAAPGFRTNTGDFFLRISLGLRAHRTEFLNRR